MAEGAKSHKSFKGCSSHTLVEKSEYIEDDKGGGRQDGDAEKEREKDRRRYPRGATRHDHPRG